MLGDQAGGDQRADLGLDAFIPQRVEVVVQSDRGVGTRMSVSLPIAAQPQVASPEPATIPSFDLHGRRVWIVDPQVLSIAERENEAAIERLKDCESEDRWPTGYEDLRLLDVI